MTEGFVKSVRLMPALSRLHDLPMHRVGSGAGGLRRCRAGPLDCELPIRAQAIRRRAPQRM